MMAVSEKQAPHAYPHDMFCSSTCFLSVCSACGRSYIVFCVSLFGNSVFISGLLRKRQAVSELPLSWSRFLLLPSGLVISQTRFCICVSELKRPPVLLLYVVACSKLGLEGRGIQYKSCEFLISLSRYDAGTQTHQCWSCNHPEYRSADGSEHHFLQTTLRSFHSCPYPEP